MYKSDTDKRSKIYLGGGWFSPKQLELHKAFYGDVEQDNTFNPRLFSIEGKSIKQVFDKDVSEILLSYEMHAMTCQNDTGTIWEIGFAHALGIPIYILIESLEVAKECKTNLMITSSIAGVVTLDMYSEHKFDKDKARELRDTLFSRWEDVE